MRTIDLRLGGVLALAAVLAFAGAVYPVKSQVNGSPRVPDPPAGDAKAGRDVFRFETFGNEGFWTDAAQLPQGMKAEKITPLQLLETGFHIDADALPADLRKAFGDEFKTDRSPAKAPNLNDPAVSEKIVQANALIGVVPKGKKVGVACALCHTITDGSILQMEGKGSIGTRIDGRTPHSLDVGKALSVAANSRVFYPILQLELGGKTLGRAPKGLRRDSTEAEVDAYLTNKEYWPVGTHDDTPDGIGNSIVIAPVFRQDLAAPFGSNGLNERLEGFNNLAYSVLLDLTTLATPEGREFLVATGGKNGQELYDNYVAILKETGVTGYPYLQAKTGFKAGHRDHPTGRMVDAKKLADFTAYVRSLPAPAGAKVDVAAFARGQQIFQAACTKCHTADPAKPVSPAVIPLGEIWPGYKPEKLADRKPPLSPIENAPGTFDDKMVVVDASERGEKRGVALPLLFDLARKPQFLHDDSVPGLDILLDPKRGADAPHPFYVAEAGPRADVVAFLKGLDITIPAPSKGK